MENRAWEVHFVCIFGRFSHFSAILNPHNARFVPKNMMYYKILIVHVFMHVLGSFMKNLIINCPRFLKKSSKMSTFPVNVGSNLGTI